MNKLVFIMEKVEGNVNLSPSETLLLNTILGKLDVLENKFNDRIERISSSIVEIKSDLNTLKNATEMRIKNVEKKVEEIMDSQSFINNEYEKNKSDMKQLLQKDMVRGKEIQNLRGEIENLHNELDQERQARNADAQYLRSSYMVEINGLNVMDDEKTATDTKKLVCNIAKMANFSDFASDQIDMCHRINKKN